MAFPHGAEVDWLRVQVRSGKGWVSTFFSLVASDETSSSLSTSRATRLTEQQQQRGIKTRDAAVSLIYTTQSSPAWIPSR